MLLFRLPRHQKTRYLLSVGQLLRKGYSLYFDDLIYMGTNRKMVEDFKKAMMKEFE